jgi:sugar phosphate isomerase/epimerase
MKYPRIYLAVDNCFASKRWTTPEAWARVIRDVMGLTCVEASADNEIDPLYSPPAVRRTWVAQVKRVQARMGVRVVNLYSGHGTYATLGLGHTDKRVRDHILKKWVKPMAQTAGGGGGGMGFFAHAFPQSVLEDRQEYEKALDDLTNRLAQAAVYGAEAGARVMAVEQMYSPHQPPWTVVGARRLLAEVLRRRGAPLYVTLDVGHQYGQSRFLHPSREALIRWLDHRKGGGLDRPPWVGTTHAQELLISAAGMSGPERDRVIAGVLEESDRNPHLFATAQDGDPYEWLAQLGCYSPIIHLQQTDNTASAHKAFTPEHNATGIIEPKKVLRAIRAAYDQPLDSSMPSRIGDVYLTLEMFSGTADKAADILDRMQASAAYWRAAVPVDGQALDAILGSQG